ncbi:hypothetical protein [Novosphingopyxis sp.]|uniref:hypothetical protein n=1 Tax=Novosphingopyxis sp. TaxID=2709690 RepID=UPI003B5A5893
MNAATSLGRGQAQFGSVDSMPHRLATPVPHWKPLLLLALFSLLALVQLRMLASPATATLFAKTRRDPALVNRFDYDGEYGTVLNRFLVEAAIGHPLTVHGTGGQTRAFINIQNTVGCIALALAHPPESGERMKIANQVAETMRVEDLAKLVSQLSGAEISYVTNPRKEAAQNDLAVSNATFRGLGLDPIMRETRC